MRVFIAVGAYENLFETSPADADRAGTIASFSTMISRTPRMAFAGVALALTMAACASTDTDDAATVTTDGDATVTTDGDATVATTPTATDPGSDTASTDAPAEQPATESEARTAQPDPTAPSEPEPAAVPAALQFSAPLVGGGEFDGAAVAGKPTLFWFWAPT